MKILWLCNMPTPSIAQAIDIPKPIFCGWIAGASAEVSSVDGIELAICFPQKKKTSIIKGIEQGIRYFGFPKKDESSTYYDTAAEKYLSEVLDEFHPDIVHIWGTEYPHTLAMAKVANQKYKVVCSTQGLCGPISKHYLSTLSYEELHIKTIRNYIKRDGFIRARKNMEVRGKNEAEALKLIPYVIGRTRWDRACTSLMAPQAKYFHCNETLRSSFYEHVSEWNVEDCQKYSIFLSQSYTPIKGAHIAIDALAILVKQYPNAKLYTTGRSPFDIDFYKIDEYMYLLKKKIERYGLKDHIVFLGSLSEEKMLAQFLKSNVFIMTSTIENSPNSLGEAMILGVPCVASYVGGIMDLIEDKKEGYLYQTDAPYMLAYYIKEIFDNKLEAEEMGRKASIHAQKTHNPKENSNQLMSIYKDIYVDNSAISG